MRTKALVVITSLFFVNIPLECIPVKSVYPLHYAAFCNTLQEVKQLIEYGAEVTAQDGDGDTPLHYAVLHGDFSICHELLIYGGHQTVNSPNRLGNTPLHNAAMSGNEHIIQLFLACCADPNARNKTGATPLHYAATHNKKAAAQLLLQAGASVRARDKNGNTPLHFAAFKNNIEMVELLVYGYKASPITKNNNGATILHLAAAFGHTELALWLAYSFFHQHLRSIKDAQGNTPLHYAMKSGNKEHVRNLITMLLLNLNVTNNKGETPLHYAAQHGLSEMADLLVNGGADLNCRTEAQRTPLGLARAHRSQEIVTVLQLRRAQE